MKNFKRNIYRLSGSECDFTGFAEEIPDRSVTKSKKVLILSDPNSVKFEEYITDVPLADIATTIQNRETALGMIPTVMLSYAAFEALTDVEIAEYAHIWDIGYDTLITANAGNKFLTYLSGGGAIFFLGENSSFLERDSSLISLITLAGGGAVATNGIALGMTQATVEPQFRVANQNPIVFFNAPGAFSNIGSANILSQSNGGTHGAVWKTGSLSNAPTGAIVSVLDINFLVIPNIQPDFIDNLSVTLNVA
jgi:hypothetical protein